METTIKMTFEQAKEQFANAVLAIYKANYLLEDSKNRNAEMDVTEIKRELQSSKLMAAIFFKMLLENGIPENLFSYHLQ